jgi:hypothetical protein
MYFLVFFLFHERTCFTPASPEGKANGRASAGRLLMNRLAAAIDFALCGSAVLAL